MSAPEIAAVVIACVAGAAIIAYGIYQIVRAIRARPAYRTARGLEVHENGVTDPPSRAEAERYLDRVDVDLAQWRISMGQLPPTPNFFAGLILFWMPATRCALRPSGVIEPDPNGSLYMFRDPEDRRPGRKHDWYAGRRKGNVLCVAWPYSLKSSALAHEVGHVIAEIVTGNPDTAHILYPELWEVVG